MCSSDLRCRAQAPDAQAQQLWLTGPAVPRHAGSSQTRARICVPCLSRQTLNHWATREALIYLSWPQRSTVKLRIFSTQFGAHREWYIHSIIKTRNLEVNLNTSFSHLPRLVNFTSKVYLKSIHVWLSLSPAPESGKPGNHLLSLLFEIVSRLLSLLSFLWFPFVYLLGSQSKFSKHVKNIWLHYLTTANTTLVVHCSSGLSMAF